MALHISEICREICLQVKGDGFSNTKAWRRTLSVLARTSRAFSDPALDILWEEVHGFQPLLDLLPDFLTNSQDHVLHSEFDEDVVVSTLSRPVRPEEWNRFDIYSPRIRVFHYNHDKECYLAQLYNDLAASKNRPLLPRLSCLVFRFSYSPPFSTLLLSLAIFRTTTSTSPIQSSVWLQKLALEIDASSHQESLKDKAFFDSLPSHYPNIEEFVLPILHSIPALDFLQDFGHLRSLKIVSAFGLFHNRRRYDMDSQALKVLSSLPYLTSLSIRTDVRLSTQVEIPSPPGFPLLNSLLITRCDASTIQIVFHNISSSHLSTIFVNINQGDWLQVIPSLALMSRKFNSSLKSLTCITSRGIRYPPNDLVGGIVRMGVITPFLPLRHLTHLELSYYPASLSLEYSAILSVEEAKEMSCAWAQLEFFTLDTDWAAFSFASFATFVSSCPHLTRVILSRLLVDKQPEDSIAHIPRSTTPHPLDFLRVDEWAKEPAYDIPLANCLDRLFPHLNISLWESTGDLRDVKNYIMELRAAR
ncbi:hypothetical protein JAAARDRAFT_211810 [Jaapia argillacea MUCL 33604]|uniref:F-box domain-containing protein n=1 Tax=Jaapia argillacea MUCL 33604 TaxID=933084 RepID=A0A067P916_9AGAM|nr:hypothetical protein JAAARDRAFT_211810 [Jaapia argillacea MUCL 33604]